MVCSVLFYFRLNSLHLITYCHQIVLCRVLFHRITLQMLLHHPRQHSHRPQVQEQLLSHYPQSKCFKCLHIETSVLDKMCVLFGLRPIPNPLGLKVVRPQWKYTIKEGSIRSFSAVHTIIIRKEKRARSSISSKPSKFFEFRKSEVPGTSGLILSKVHLNPIQTQLFMCCGVFSQYHLCLMFLDSWVN